MEKIKFVRKYENYGNTWIDVVYRSRRVRTYLESDLPKTIANFMEKASTKTEQYDHSSVRANKWETIYQA